MRHLHKHQKQDIVENYIKYKKYYDMEAQAFPLRLHQYCHLLNPKLDTQEQKMNKMEPRWLALYRVEKKINHENYLVREVGTNHTQIVHRIRLREYNPRHRIKDLDEINPEKFIQDPKFPEEYQQPAIFDKVKESLLWHPELAENPDIEENEHPPPIKRQIIPATQSYLFTRDPRVRITRMNLRSRSVPVRTKLMRVRRKIHSSR